MITPADRHNKHGRRLFLTPIPERSAVRPSVLAPNFQERSLIPKERTDPRLANVARYGAVLEQDR